jgi:Arc/MetJ-type ribon-helix-helix transcriptional regulator
MAHDRYRSIRLPEELLEEVEKEVKLGKRGYKSIAEFVKDAIRVKLLQMEYARKLDENEENREGK